MASALTNADDMAFVLRGLALRPLWLWRVAMGVAGGCLYLAVLRRAGADLPSGRPLAVAYLAVAAVACVGPVFFRGALLPALREGVLESLGSSGLLYLALRRPLADGNPGATVPVPCSRGVVLAAVPIVALFWLWLGRGLVGA